MAQKLVSQASTLGRTFDEPRHISHHKALLGSHAHHAQIRMQGGEGVVGDFGTGVGDGTDERGLACVGHAQQADIGQHLEFELEVFAVARPARRFLAGRAVDRTFEPHIAKTAVTAFGDHDDFARVEQLVQHVVSFGVNQQGAYGHFQNDVVTGCAKHVRAHAVLAAFGLVAFGETVVHQGVQARVRHSKHMAAAATVAAVGSAKFFVFLMTKRHAAIPAVASDDVYIRFINKFHGTIFKRKAPTSGAFDGVV